MSPLRQRLIEELQLHRKADSTIEAYVAAVADLAKFFHRSPDQLEVADIRKYLHHLIAERRLARSTVNQRICGLRFFYGQVLQRPECVPRVPLKGNGRIPDPLGRNEVAQLLAAADNPKHRVLLMITYGGGLRVSAVVRLRPEQILSDRMLIRFNLTIQRLLGHSQLSTTSRYLHVTNQHLQRLTSPRICCGCPLRPHYHVHGLSPAGAWQAATGRWAAGGTQVLVSRARGESRVPSQVPGRTGSVVGGGRVGLARHTPVPPGVLPHAWLRYWRRREWVVYAQPPFAGPSKLLDYLGRYTHRAAIGHERLKAYDGRRVTFRYRDRADDDRVKSLTLDASEFLARFVTHVLPDRFQRVRHYGFLANRGKAERLANIRRALGVYDRSTTTIEPPVDWIAWLREIVGAEALRCPRCGRELQGASKRIRMLRRANGQPEIGGNPLLPNTNLRYRNL